MNSKKHVVVVEDDPSLSFLVKEYLSNADFDVITFSNPEKAISYILRNNHKISVIVTDFDLNSIHSGYSLFSAISAINTNLPVILWTGMYNDLIPQMLEDGLFRYVKKDCDSWHTLVNAVYEASWKDNAYDLCL